MFENKDNFVWKTKESLIIKVPYGDLDGSNSNGLVALVGDVLKKHSANLVILDFSLTALVDGAGLASIVKIWSILNDYEIKLVLCSLSQNLLETFKIKKLDTVITVTSTLQEAMQSGNSYLETVKAVRTHGNALEGFFGDPCESQESLTSADVAVINEKPVNYAHVS